MIVVDKHQKDRFDFFLQNKRELRDVCMDLQFTRGNIMMKGHGMGLVKCAIRDRIKETSNDPLRFRERLKIALKYRNMVPRINGGLTKPRGNTHTDSMFFQLLGVATPS